MYAGSERLLLNLAKANVKKLIKKVRNQLDDIKLNFSEKPVYKVHKRSFPTKYFQKTLVNRGVWQIKTVHRKQFYF
jgi:hypothetical protein